MMEKCRAPSIIRKAISRQLASTTASDTLQPSASALATPAESIFRLASCVSRCVATISDIGDPRILVFAGGACAVTLNLGGRLARDLGRAVAGADHQEFAGPPAAD